MEGELFECRGCGHCCERIVVDNGGLHLGLCLHPGEETLFSSFSDAVVPCIGIKRPGRSRVKTICYQMVMEPCPLYDSVMKRCTMYRHRPVSCRAYPFSFTANGGHSLEVTCSWSKTLPDIEYGKTKLTAGVEQNVAAMKEVEFFRRLRGLMERTGRTILVMFDIESRTWVEMSRHDVEIRT